MINKIDVAPMVGASLEVMRVDAARQRGERPTVFTSLVDDPLATRRGRLRGAPPLNAGMNGPA